MGDFTEIAVNTTFPPLHDFFFSMPEICFWGIKSVFGKNLGSFWKIFGNVTGV